jgi:hypothetical protein
MNEGVEAEVKALGAVTQAVKGLPPEAIHRVLSAAGQLFLAKPLRSGSGPASDAVSPPATMGAGADSVTSQFREFHELFDAANPGTMVDKVLVAGYWYQVVEGSEDLDSLELNRALKNLGHPSSNITRDLDALIRRTPRLVMQVSKGPTKSGRKRYKLTREGERAVSRMILATRGNGGSDLMPLSD